MPDRALLPPTVTFKPDTGYLDREWQGIPGIERTGDGTLWATWYSGGSGEGPDNYVLLVRSDDDGSSWTKPQFVIDPPEYVRAFDPCLWVDPHGTLWLFWAQEHIKWDGKAGVWALRNPHPRSKEGWSHPRRLCDGIMMNKPVATSNDRSWIYPATCWDRPPQTFHFADEIDLSVDAIRDRTTPVHIGRTPTSVYVSDDYGQSVTEVGGPQVPAGVASAPEHMLVELQDGRLWMLIRTRYGIGESFSSDGGSTWTPVQTSGLDHPTSRFFIRRLNSDSLLLVKHDSRTERTDLTAYVSRNDGESWIGGFRIDTRDAVSYPDAIQAPDGLIYLIYDRDRKGAGDILMATFRESDVEAGQAVSGDVRREQVISTLG